MQQIYVLNGIHQQQQMRNIGAVHPLHAQSVHIVQQQPIIMVPQPQPQQYQSQIPQNTLIVFKATEQNGVDPYANHTHMTSNHHVMNSMNFVSDAFPQDYPYNYIGSNPHHQYSVNNIIKNDPVNIQSINRLSLPLAPRAPILFNATNNNMSVSDMNPIRMNHSYHRTQAESADSAQADVISLSELKQRLKEISCDVTNVNTSPQHNTPSHNTPEHNKTLFSISTPYRSSPSTNSTVSNTADYSNINISKPSNSASASASSTTTKSGNTRIYECLYCNHKFKQSHSLKDHIRTHTGEKPYQCTYCARRFKVKYNMIVHTRIHTGVKPYGCEVCAKRYASKSGLNAHCKKHHPAQWKKAKLDSRK